tara:strand:- start:318 stop:650 length:333 start_codon:yes stop_codon:yes gene_type:complete
MVATNARRFKSGGKCESSMSLKEGGSGFLSSSSPSACTFSVAVEKVNPLQHGRNNHPLDHHPLKGFSRDENGPTPLKLLLHVVLLSLLSFPLLALSKNVVLVVVTDPFGC